jgi:hypothetical protein
VTCAAACRPRHTPLLARIRATWPKLDRAPAPSPVLDLLWELHGQGLRVTSRFSDGPTLPPPSEGRNCRLIRLHRRRAYHRHLPSTLSSSSRWAAAIPLCTEITETARRHSPMPFCITGAATTGGSSGRGSDVRGSDLPRDSRTSGVAHARATWEKNKRLLLKHTF